MRHLWILFFLFLLSGCENDWNPGDPRKEIYSEAFKSKFDVPIDSTHTWGFDYYGPGVSRSVNPNSNEWYIVPPEITTEERDLVYTWFSTHKDPQGVSVSWSDYFVQQVHGQNSQMDKLICSKDGKTEFDHVYNFNRASGDIQLMTNSVSSYFGYHYSKDSRDHFKFVVVEIGGNFYVGLDAEATGENPNQQEKADGYYSDWIVKITPCLPKPEYGRRILCEDLGSIGDFDFNDLVFDAYVDYNPYYPPGSIGLLILQGVGGTLPIYLEGQEVHDLFGVSLGTLVNVWGGKTVSSPPVVLRFTPRDYGYKDIRIMVISGKDSYLITSDQGEAPGKICVPPYVEWTSEGQGIHNKYPKFKEWIEDKNKPFWN